MPSGATQSTLHKALVRDVARYVRSLKGYPYKVFGGAFGAAGMPDFLCAVPIPGWPIAAVVAIECKTGSAKLNPSQVKIRAVLEAARVLYIVAHSDVEVEEALLAARLIPGRTLQRKLIEEPA